MRQLVRAPTRKPDEVATSGYHQWTFLVELIILRGNLTHFGSKLKIPKSVKNQNFGFLGFLLEVEISELAILLGNLISVGPPRSKKSSIPSRC